MTAAEQVSSIAFCWCIERRDGAGLALTSHDQELVHGGERYAADPGMMPAAITRQLGLEPHSAEVAGALSSDAITESDLELGKWDGARVTLIAVDWQSPETEAVPLLAGELGEVSISGTGFSAELRGAAWKLNAPVCPATSPECRAQLGDKKCRADLAGRSVRAEIVSGSGNELQLDRTIDGRFLFGRLRFLSGDNCGASTIVLSAQGNKVRVRDLPRRAVQAGCRVELREGCDKRFETCVSRFGNAVNFRGEPHLPGNDLLTRYPGA